MSPEWLTAIGTLGTFLVIAASAAAALFQLRHMRGSNQIVALTEVRETLESAEFQAALRYVAHDLQERLKDPQCRQEILAPGPTPAEYEPMRTVANFFDSTGALVRRGIIDSDIACEIWGYVVLRNWGYLAEMIANIRAARDFPALFENFEYWAVLSARWNKANPHGSYPHNLERMPPRPLWPEMQRPNSVR